MTANFAAPFSGGASLGEADAHNSIKAISFASRTMDAFCSFCKRQVDAQGRRGAQLSPERKAGRLPVTIANWTAKARS
jgi:hypothetical protein